MNLVGWGNFNGCCTLGGGAFPSIFRKPKCKFPTVYGGRGWTQMTRALLSQFCPRFFYKPVIFSLPSFNQIPYTLFRVDGHHFIYQGVNNNCFWVMHIYYIYSMLYWFSLLNASCSNYNSIWPYHIVINLTYDIFCDITTFRQHFLCNSYILW